MFVTAVADAVALSAILAVHAIYIGTLNIAVFTTDTGAPKYHLAVLLMPISLSIPWSFGQTDKHLRLRMMLTGVLLGACANVCLLTVPYFGIYPSILTLVAGMAYGGNADAGPRFYLPILIANLVFWPICSFAVGKFFESVLKKKGVGHTIAG